MLDRQSEYKKHRQETFQSFAKENLEQFGPLTVVILTDHYLVGDFLVCYSSAFKKKKIYCVRIFDNSLYYFI